MASPLATSANWWDWLIEQDQRTVLALLALCAGHSVDAVESKRDPDPPTRHAGQLAAALKLDMAAYWQPTDARDAGRNGDRHACRST